MDIICSWHIANSILIKSFKEKNYITTLKLNCLVYLLYGEYLYLTGEKLFNVPFMKTEKGPISFSIYEKFGSYRKDVIKSYARDSMGKVRYVQSEIFDECLTSIWEKYKNKSEEDILLHLENGYRYNKTPSSYEIDDSDILNDIINIKEEELENAKSYAKRLIQTRYIGNK